VRVTDAPHEAACLAARGVRSTCKGGKPPFDPPLLPLWRQCGTPLRFHASEVARMTANDNSLPVTRRSGSQKRRRNRHIDVCCDESEFVIIDDKARTAGMSMAAFLRTCSLGSPGPRAQRAPTVNAEALAHATLALNKVGSNLNQLLKILHSGNAPIAANECHAALADVRAAVVRILDIVGRKTSL